MTKTNWGLLKIDHKLTCHKCGKTTFKKLKIKKPVCSNCKKIAERVYYIKQSYAKAKDNGK